MTEQPHAGRMRGKQQERGRNNPAAREEEGSFKPQRKGQSRNVTLFTAQRSKQKMLL